MNAAPRKLDELQQWLLTAVTKPAAVAGQELEEAILPSRQQSAAERLAVYQHAYIARLLEVLREQFPATRFAAGDETFDQLALGYVQAHPPASYTLARLADQFAVYLEATRPADWGEFLVELAQLEQAIERVFDGPGPEHAAPFAFPADADESLRLNFSLGFELHAFRHPVSTFYTDWKAARGPSWPEPGEQYVALWRRDFIVRRMELTREQFDVLASLADGATLNAALRAAGQPGRLSYEAVQEWFTSWTAGGFFAGVSGPNCP